MRIEVQHCLPQANTPFLQQVFVGHAAASLSSQDDVHQALVLAHQTIQAGMAPRLSAGKGDWPIQIEWVYNGHETPPLDWDLTVLAILSNP
jgi:hypothetical protein